MKDISFNAAISAIRNLLMLIASTETHLACADAEHHDRR
jgi:hypothetical protein